MQESFFPNGPFKIYARENAVFNSPACKNTRRRFSLFLFSSPLSLTPPALLSFLPAAGKGNDDGFLLFSPSPSLPSPPSGRNGGLGQWERAEEGCDSGDRSVSGEACGGRIRRWGGAAAIARAYPTTADPVVGMCGGSRSGGEEARE
jgi:hypothetical protein